MALPVPARRPFAAHMAALALGLLLAAAQGVELYSNSFISPMSSSAAAGPRGSLEGRTAAPRDIGPAPPHTPEEEPSRTSGIDGLLAYKNVEESMDSNDVERSGGFAHYIIQPSKTVHLPAAPAGGEASVRVPQRHAAPASGPPGEGPGAPQARSLALQESREISPTATAPPPPASTAARGRQANPDIQDIITGIVKLLNGKVNVQANTGPAAGRPVRPVSTRINNRGPPRITDLPALPPDFDVPAPPLPPPPPLGPKPPQPTRMPTPYPFDLPPQGAASARPPFYRPVTIPPWGGRPRKPPRRPAPPVPPLKPPPQAVSLTSERPVGDILTLNLGAQLEPSGEEPPINETSQGEHKTASKIEDTPPGGGGTAANTTTTDAGERAPVGGSVEVGSAEMTINATNVTGDIVLNTAIASMNSSATENATTAPASAAGGGTNATASAAAVSEMTTTIVPTTASSTMDNILPTSTNAATVSPNATNLVSSTDASPPTLESSIQEVLQTLKDDLLAATSSPSARPTEALPAPKAPTVSHVTIQNVTQTAPPPYTYRPRPGIVLDDTEYKPGHSQPIVTRPPVGAIGDIFDVTVSAIQGPGGGVQGKPYIIPVQLPHAENGGDVITSPVGSEGFVSIDGKRTYLNLFGEGPATGAGPLRPTVPATNQVTGTGFAVVDDKAKPHLGPAKPAPRRPPARPRPSHQPPVRIDTCIVGDDSTCDTAQHEICRTEAGVSACHCRPGHARRKHREPCRRIVSVLLSLRVDRLYERPVVWARELADKNSNSYHQLSYEAERALESAMSMTPFSDQFLGAQVNSIYRGERAAGHAGVYVNMTLQLDETAETARAAVKAEIQHHLLGVIQRRSNNVGNSALWVDSPPGSVSNLQDLDECSSPELHDCHAFATCINVFGGFKCECREGYRDPWADSRHRAGRQCEQCSAHHCNNRGECKYQNGQEVCVCSGNYYGNQCELDGEVLGVAIGASVAAVIIIGLTLVFLVMWSRRWNREQKAAVGSPVFGYMATASNTVKTPAVGAPPYQLTLEDRLRWAQIADVMAQTNHYAPEPVTAPTRPSSAIFGYPGFGTLQRPLHGTLPPVPLPRLNLQAQLAGRAASIHGMRPLDNSSSSEEEDKVDLLGRNFQVPRPKSRSNASIANQSGIYYDVDYDQNEIYKQAGGIPLSTYSVGRPTYFRN